MGLCLWALIRFRGSGIRAWRLMGLGLGLFTGLLLRGFIEVTKMEIYSK